MTVRLHPLYPNERRVMREEELLMSEKAKTREG